MPLPTLPLWLPPYPNLHHSRLMLDWDGVPLRYNVVGTSYCLNLMWAQNVWMQTSKHSSWSGLILFQISLRNFEHSPSQSVLTILVLKTWVGLWPWKKSGQKYGMQKAGCKKQGHYYSKREEGSCLFSFWMTMTLFFAPCFLTPYFGPCFFKVPDPKKISGRPDKLE